MSTLSGIVSKGEKGKSKFQSLDINSLYRVSRGESLEPHQQKNTLPRKHGMQSLGKVPSARRPPANLPSLKSETSSSDPAVSLVPSGGSGWATTKDSTSSTTTTTTVATSPDNTTTVSSSAQCAAGTTVSTSLHSLLPGQQNVSQSPFLDQTNNKSSWSAIMSRSGDGGTPGNQQQSNRELNAQYGPGPSLRPQTEGSWIQGGSRTASGAAPPTSAGPGNGNTPGGQGLPLNIPVSGGHTQEGPGGGRQNLGQSPNMGAGPAGQHNSVNNQGSAPSSGTHQIGPNLHHYRGLIPPFMYRSNFPGGFPPQFASNSGSNNPRPRFNHPLDRFPPPQRERVAEEEILTRPIIKEEDLTRMDDISRDAGWAAHDDIDYNQKLAFSDDELESEPSKTDEKKDIKEKKNDDNAAEEKEKSRDNPRDPKELRDPPHRPWTQPSMNRDYRGSNGASGSGGYNNQSQLHSVHSLRGVEDDETWNERRRIKVEVASVVERARLRKEEEEKRFQESTKQAAAKKLQDLEQKMKEKQAKHKDEERAQSSDSKSLISVPPVPLPIPEWEREKENRERESRERERERSRTSSEGKDEKIIASGRESRDNLAREGRDQGLADFRQNDRQTFLRQQDTARSERERERDRDQRDSRDRDQPAFSRHFQNNLPPRFQKQQAERSGANFNRISPNAERPATQSVPFSQQYDPSRWLHNYNSLNSGMKQSIPPQRRNRTDSDASAPLDDERPPSRDHRSGGAPPSREDRYRHSSHRSYDGRKPGYYDEYSRNFRDYEYDDRHPRDSWERERHFDDKERDPKENLDSRDNRDSKDSRPTSRDARDVRDMRDRDNKEKKDYDSYSKDSFDEREQRERSESSEWREERNAGQDRQLESRRDAPKEERSERPQRPDSRDSRTSRESKTSLRDDELHKLRDCNSWVSEVSDYEEKKRDLLYHEEVRERDRDRRQPPGPVTKEKIEADELKNEKRSLTQLKRGSSDLQEKKDQAKESTTETKKDTDVWNRKTERTSETRQIERGDNSPKAWADAISPTFEKEEEKIVETVKESKESDEIKQSLLDKPTLEKREETITEDVKEQVKDEKREKNTRNRTSSGSSSSRVRESRGGRQWGGTFSVFTRWRGPESRGRRGGRPAAGKSGMSAKSGSYGHTDSENSADEVSGSTESGKEDKRSARSPKPSQKVEKEERNREVSRRDDKRGTEAYSQARSDKRSYDGKPSHEAFAPSGEPSRRGRGGFRVRNTATGSRMEGYGPPSSKSPFSERNADEKHQQQNVGRQNPPTPTSEKDASLLQPASVESTDDKIIAKQQALTAGITGRRNKSPSQQTQQSANKQEANQGANVLSQKAQIRKEESRSKRTRSGSRRGRDNREARSRGSSSNVSKQPQSDVGNEDWETTSENSEEHIEDHKESRNSRNKHFGGRAIQATNQNAIGANSHSRRNEQSTNAREQREKNPKSSNPASRAPGAEKRNLQNAGFGAQKNHNTDGIPPLMQNTQIQNGGRSRSQSSTNSGAISNKSSNKDSMVNRIDEIKLTDPNLVNQALNDLNKKSQTKDKKLMDSEMETNSCAEDTANAAAEDKVDADGFQEVRSKKNVKESRHSQKEEAKPVKRDKEKERERDRSKSKSNGSQQALQQQVQNIPPLLGQNIPQPANIPQKREYDNRNSRNPRLAPRFQRLVKQQQQQMCATDASDMNKLNSSGNNYAKDSSSNPAPPPAVNAWDKPFTSQLRSNSPSAVPTDIQLMSSLTTQNDHSHEGNEANSGHSSQRNSPSGEKTVKNLKETLTEKNVVSDVSSPPVQTLIFENTNYSKTTKTTGPTDLAVKSKFSNHIKTQQQRAEKRVEMEEEGNSQVQQHPQQPALSVAFPNKPNDLIKDKNQEPIQMPLSFNKNEDNADMKLDFTFDSDLSQLTEDKSKSLGMPRSIHMTGGQSTISPSTAELNLKIASVKKVWENAPPMPTVVEHEDGSGVVGSTTSFPQAFESGDVDDSYSPHQQYNQNNMKSEITTSTNVCKVKPQQQSSGSSGTQPGSTVPGPSPIGAGQSPIGHPPVSLQGPLSPPPFNSTGQPSHINYQEFPQYPGSQAAQYGGMSAIPSPPAVLFNTGSGQLPAQAGGLYGAFQLDQSRSPFTQYAPYAPSLQSSFSQQNVYLQQPPPPPPHAPNAPTPEMYQNNLSQYRITAAAAPPFGQNQQLSNNPNTVLISSSSNSLMSASVKPSSQPIGAIGTKAPHFQTPSAPQPNQLAYIPYDPNQVLGVSGSYLNNSQLVQRPGPNVQASANSYYSATSADVFPGSQTGFYQSGGATQQTGTHYGLQGFGQHNQSLATGNATPVGLQNYGPSFLSSSGLQIAAAAQQFRNPTGGLPGPGNAAPTFLSKHQPQEQPRQLKSPSGNQQDVLASVFGSTSQIPSPKSRNCKQQSSSQQPQPSPTQHHKYQQYQGVSQSALVSSYNNYVLQQNVRGMGMPPRAGIQPSQQRYPPPIQRPVVPFAPGPNNPTQQQPGCMPTQQQQQTQINRHRPNLHQQQQQQRSMKMQQQYYSPQGNVKMDSNDKTDNHNDKMNDGPSGTQSVGNKSNVNQQDSDNNKEEVNQQNE